MFRTLHAVILFPHNGSAPEAFKNAVRAGRATCPASYRRGQQWGFQDSWLEIYINLHLACPWQGFLLHIPSYSGWAHMLKTRNTQLLTVMKFWKKDSLKKLFNIIRRKKSLYLVHFKRALKNDCSKHSYWLCHHCALIRRAGPQRSPDAVK